MSREIMDMYYAVTQIARDQRYKKRLNDTDKNKGLLSRTKINTKTSESVQDDEPLVRVSNYLTTIAKARRELNNGKE